MNRLEKIAILAAEIYMDDNDYDCVDAIDAACDKLGEEIPNNLWSALDRLTKNQIAYLLEERYEAECDSQASWAEHEMYFR